MLIEEMDAEVVNIEAGPTVVPHWLWTTTVTTILATLVRVLDERVGEMYLMRFVLKRGNKLLAAKRGARTT
ncbi:hypothetical protein Tdes44962_MAKER06668 [Teratosphaeria destructans]|uniref:Uncharacterized protein n=1 Tax=Teratosphaeria destructans TaxID=418781 RepID=A0A9W7T1B4_9PEZI|nr:hypothetical protein Tdes44962_MAKER06668 [Teratosphaeria destructans]